MMNDESNRALSLVELREFIEWGRAAQLYIEKIQDSAVCAKGPSWIDECLDAAWVKLEDCFDWASIEETLKESE